MCPSTFSHKGNLPRHIATIHEGKKRTDMPPKEKSDGKGRSLYFDEIVQAGRLEGKIRKSLIFMLKYSIITV